jgi:hypothetical protein
MGVMTLTSSTVVWSALDNMFSSCTRSQSVNTCIALPTNKKGSAIMVEYFAKMKSYVDEMSPSGQSLSDEEFTAYILMDLDEDLYNALVSSIVSWVELISSFELYSQMLTYEHRVDKQSGGGSYSMSSTNAMTRGHRLKDRRRRSEG